MRKRHSRKLRVLHDIVEGATPHRFDRDVQVRVGGRHEEHGARGLGPKLVEQTETVGVRQLVVEHDHIGVDGWKRPAGLGCGRRGRDVVTLVSQVAREGTRESGVVVDDEDAAGHRGSGCWVDAERLRVGHHQLDRLVARHIGHFGDELEVVDQTATHGGRQGR